MSAKHLSSLIISALENTRLLLTLFSTVTVLLEDLYLILNSRNAIRITTKEIVEKIRVANSGTYIEIKMKIIDSKITNTMNLYS